MSNFLLTCRMMPYSTSTWNFSHKYAPSLQFDNQPDQIGRIIGTDPNNILYFCEVSFAQADSWRHQQLYLTYTHCLFVWHNSRTAAPTAEFTVGIQLEDTSLSLRMIPWLGSFGMRPLDSPSHRTASACTCPTRAMASFSK